MSPALRRTTSPGTRSSAPISCHWPPRRARALRASSPLSASRALSALRSCQKPTAALNTSITQMMIMSDQWRTTSDNTAAASIIQGMGPQK